MFSSTAAVYGEPESVPITEDAATLPVNPYGASKLAFEELLEGCRWDFGFRSVRFRYFNVAGAWPDGSMGEAHDPESHLIPRILRAMADGQSSFEVFGNDYPTPDGTCVRDYIHVLDLAQAHRLALESLGVDGAGGVFNLGNGRGYSNLEIVRACAEVTGREVDGRLRAAQSRRSCRAGRVRREGRARARLAAGARRAHGDRRRRLEMAPGASAGVRSGRVALVGRG